MLRIIRTIKVNELYSSIYDLHDRCVTATGRTDTAERRSDQVQEHLRAARRTVDAFRRQSAEIQAVISRLDIRESTEAWDLGVHIVASQHAILKGDQ
jgi:hypothetical protein